MKYLKILALSLFLCGAFMAHAQWDLGVKAGLNINSIDRSNLGRIDEIYYSMPGFDVGVFGRYQFNEWLGLRADLSFMSRNHGMDRNVFYLKNVYTAFLNTYMMLPVMADFSINLEKFHIHFMGGGFMGYWLTARRYGQTSINMSGIDHNFNEKIEFNKYHNRFSAGIVAGAGVEYDLSEKWAIGLDYIFYHDFVSYMKVNKIAADTRFYDTYSLTFGLIYKL